MANPHDLNTPIVLKLELNCCNTCPNQLKKVLLRIDGVKSVQVYEDMNLAVVSGNVDPKMLIKIINRAGKEVRCLEEKQQGVGAGKERCDQQEEYSGKDKCPENGYCTRGPNYNKKRRDSNNGNDHVVENFEGPRCEEFGEDICRDSYCRTHTRKQDRTPPMYSDHPPPGHYPGAPPPLFREFPPPPPPPYGYPSSSMRPPGYGGRGRRPPFGDDYYYGDCYDANRGCATM